MNWLKSFLPIYSWLPHYKWSLFRGDLLAGITVGVMLVPQAMAYAMLAGLPPVYGLYASLIPLVLYAIFGTSKHLAVGTQAIDMIIVAAGVGVLAPALSEPYINIVLALTLSVGILQVLMALARLGFLVNFLSRPVIAGFAAAAPIVIAFTQLKHLLGVALKDSFLVQELLLELALKFRDIHIPTFLLGISGIVFILLIRAFSKMIPGSLIVVVLGAFVVWAFDLHLTGVEIVGYVPGGLPLITVPMLDWDLFKTILPLAFTLALVQFTQVITLAKVFAEKHRYSIDANKELLALGAANVFGSFFRSSPVSCSFSRTAVNEQAGASSQFSNVVSAGVVVLVLCFFTEFFYYLPVTILAAIIIVACVLMIDLNEIHFLFTTKLSDGLVAIATFLVTLCVGIQEGILAGVLASLLTLVYRITRPNVAVLGRVPGTTVYRDIIRFPEAETVEGVNILRFDGMFSFTNAKLVKDQILKAGRDDDSTQAVIIDASSVNDLDTTSLGVLESAVETLKDRKIEIYFAGMKGPVRDILEGTRLLELLSTDAFTLTVNDAVKRAQNGR